MLIIKQLSSVSQNNLMSPAEIDWWWTDDEIHALQLSQPMQCEKSTAPSNWTKHPTDECQILAAISFLLQSSDMRSLTLVNLDGSHNTPTTRKAQTDAMTVIIVRRNKCAFEREMPLSGRTPIHPTHDHPRTRPPTQIVNNHCESLEINFEWVNQLTRRLHVVGVESPCWHRHYPSDPTEMKVVTTNYSFKA